MNLINVYANNNKGQDNNIQVELSRWKANQFQLISDVVSQEVPVLIKYGKKSNNVWHQLGAIELWACPIFLEDLAVGTVLLESKPQVNFEYFFLEQEDVNDLKNHAGLLFHSVFKLTIQESIPKKISVDTKLAIKPEEVVEAMRNFMGIDGLWEDTGGFHRAAIFDVETKTILKLAEDIGRHNCIDRLKGWATINKLDLSNYILLVSARMSASLCAKALKAGFRFLISRSAVTSSAVEMAKNAEATLLGFARDKEGRFTVFNDSKNLVQK
ncbi:formate dehydrogenase accessory sulfurtransferase FdhD [Desulfovibrio litoralis]|uniref:FdhD protein n=1 Tax=Desulfovibrio litoralis DSM 11393 TaxID=1121455 RepID=A0A1M7T8P3_9BACT|nr:formate dehydrogenase accessory sulfurtransferase FdhD [Desulfovibrio litoralis]SHN67047.1 FdhD protein [Desulfovibrio litoralis DSM 11393]